MPVIMEVRRQPEELSVQPHLLNHYENALFRSFASCKGQEARRLAVSYWAEISDFQMNATGKRKCRKKSKVNWLLISKGLLICIRGKPGDAD